MSVESVKVESPALPYGVISGKDLTFIAITVSEAMGDGWECVGGLIESENEHGKFFMQTMVRPSDTIGMQERPMGEYKIINRPITITLTTEEAGDIGTLFDMLVGDDGPAALAPRFARILEKIKQAVGETMR